MQEEYSPCAGWIHSANEAGPSGSSERQSIDVLIIGAGGAGLSAAVAAAEKKKTVAVLEKRAASGGNAAMAGGLFAAESPVQKRLGIPLSKDDLFKAAMAHAHWKVDPRILRSVIDRSGDTIQWLEEKGVRFDVPVFYSNLPRTAHIAEGLGAGIMTALSRRCRVLGVGIHHRARVDQILLDDNQRVQGVLFHSEGKEITIYSNQVIIATGGYAGNREMLKKHYPFYSHRMHAIGLPHEGDGVRMALAIGAEEEGLGNLHLRGPYFQGAMECVVAGMQPVAMWVNKNGERFVDEGNAFFWPDAANALNLQPEQRSFSIFDEALKVAFIQEGVILGYNRFRQNAKLTRLSETLEKEIREGRAVRSDSIPEVAGFIGAPPGLLEKTLKEYNESCRKGHDSLFLKDRSFLKPILRPPYYALACHQSFFATIGGIKINHKMEVLDKTGTPIRGLYAAGNDTGGWETDTYCLALPGMAFGFAVNSGRIAGENASDACRDS